MTDIYISGIYRSGTTLCYNIARALVSSDQNDHSITPDGLHVGNYRLHKVHEELVKKKLNGIIIYCYRDILDTLVSFFDKYQMDFETFHLRNYDSLGYINAMIEMDYDVMKRKNINQLCYENFHENTEELIDTISKILEIDRPPNLDADQFLAEKIKELVKGRETFDRIDLYHPNHIGDGKIRKWEQRLKPEELKEIFTKTKYIIWKEKRYEKTLFG